MENQDTLELLVQFGSDEPTEPVQLDRLARTLNREFQQSNVVSSLLEVNAPSGTKSGLEVAAGAILVKVAPGLVPLVIEQLKKFISRSPDRSVKAKVQLGDRSVEVEYPTVNSTSQEEIASLVERLTGTIAH